MLEATASEQTTETGEAAGFLAGRISIGPRDTHAGDPRFPFGWCASPEAPTPLSVLAVKPRFATDPGDCGGAAPTSRPAADPLGVARGHSPTHRSDTTGAVRRDGRPSCGPTAPCNLRAGPRSGVRTSTKGQLPPRISFAASVRFFTPSPL
jgi:hypothetical protein